MRRAKLSIVLYFIVNILLVLPFSPIQIDEEAEKVETQFDHRLFHVGLQLPPVVDLSRVKDPHVSQWYLYIPAI